jgi:hypothetical protein
MILSKKYKEEINKIVMNDDMKKRILQNVLATNENDNSAEKNMKVKTTIPKVKKYNNLKRDMQMVVACFAMVLCLSVAKSYPMLFKHIPNDLEQKETAKSHDDANNDLKTSDDNEFVYSKDSKEISNDNHKEDQVLDQNNNYNNGDVKVESNISSKIEQEEKEKDNSQLSSSSEVEKSQTSQNNNDKAIENSNISSKTNPVEDINNKENKNPTNTEPKTTPGDIKQNRIPENNADNSVSGTSVAAKEAVNYSQEYKTLDEAEKALNLKVNSLKILPEGFKMESISVISNEIIQVEYNDGNNNIVFRAGKIIDNISGDYDVYQVKNTAKVNGININLEGNKSKEYNLAAWEKDGVSYSISAENGIDEKTILDMVL